MSRDPYDDRAARPSRKIIWIIGGVLVLLMVIFALQGVVRGTGEAVGVSDAAPGDDNAQPTADEAGGSRR